MKVGDQVGWQWGAGLATGEILGIHHERTQIESKGKVIVRNGSPDEPAIVIKSVNGSKVVKLKREIQVLQGGSHV